MLTHGTYTCYTQTHTHAQTRTNTYTHTHTHTRALHVFIHTHQHFVIPAAISITHSQCVVFRPTHTHTEVLWTLTSNWTIVEERAGLLKWPGSTQSFSFSLNIFVLFCFFFFFSLLLEIRGFFSGSVGRQTGRKLQTTSISMEFGPLYLEFFNTLQPSFAHS